MATHRKHRRLESGDWDTSPASVKLFHFISFNFILLYYFVTIYLLDLCEPQLSPWLDEAHLLPDLLGCYTAFQESGLLQPVHKKQSYCDSDNGKENRPNLEEGCGR
jgi:hypothetical protein